MELILDMHQCDVSTFTKKKLVVYFVNLCKIISMKRHGKPIFWEDHGTIPHLHGISAIQFIETSNIVVHTLHLLNAVYINVFSCKEFDTNIALHFSKKYFVARKVSSKVISRV